MVTFNKWGGIVSFLMGAFFAIAPLICLTEYLRNFIDGKSECVLLMGLALLATVFLCVAGTAAQYFIFLNQVSLMIAVKSGEMKMKPG